MSYKIKCILPLIVYLLFSFLKKETTSIGLYSNVNILTKQFVNSDSLFKVNLSNKESLVEIIPLQNSSFSLPDSTVTLVVFEKLDFNADGKKDLLINLGACGTGGCMFGLFLKHTRNKYTLAYLNYLKNIEFIIEKNGCRKIKSSETIEPYSPSKSNVTIYKLDLRTNQYIADTSYIYQTN